MNLLQSELIEHKKILDAFKGLPSDIKKYILTFYTSSNAILICPSCYAASYKVLIAEGGVFVCDHNYYKINNWLAPPVGAFPEGFSKTFICSREENA